MSLHSKRFRNLIPTDTKTTNYQAKEGEAVICDPTGGDFTVTAPANPQEGYEFSAGILITETTGLSGFVDVLSGDASFIDPPWSSLKADSDTVLFGGAAAIWQYSAQYDHWFLVSAVQVPPYVELWTATPIISMSGQTIQWTLTPLYSGQIPALVTHNAGVLTFSQDMALTVDLKIEVSMNLNGNNQDVDFDVTPVYTGTGTNLNTRIIDSFAHSRAGSFFRSKSTTGGLAADKADTLSYTANSTGTGGSDVDLDAAALILTLSG